MFYDKYFYFNNPADLSNTIVISELLVINNIFKTVLTRLGRSRKFRKKGFEEIEGVTCPPKNLGHGDTFY